MAGPLFGGFLGTTEQQTAYDARQDHAQTAEMLQEIARAGNDPDAILGIQARLKGPPTKGAADLLAGAMKWAQGAKAYKSSGGLMAPVTTPGSPAVPDTTMAIPRAEDWTARLGPDAGSEVPAAQQGMPSAVPRATATITPGTPAVAPTSRPPQGAEMAGRIAEWMATQPGLEHTAKAMLPFAIETSKEEQAQRGLVEREKMAQESLTTRERLQAEREAATFTPIDPKFTNGRPMLANKLGQLKEVGTPEEAKAWIQFVEGLKHPPAFVPGTEYQSGGIFNPMEALKNPAAAFTPVGGAGSPVMTLKQAESILAAEANQRGSQAPEKVKQALGVFMLGSNEDRMRGLQTLLGGVPGTAPPESTQGMVEGNLSRRQKDKVEVGGAMAGATRRATLEADRTEPAKIEPKDIVNVHTGSADQTGRPIEQQVQDPNNAIVRGPEAQKELRDALGLSGGLQRIESFVQKYGQQSAGSNTMTFIAGRFGQDQFARDLRAAQTSAQLLTEQVTRIYTGSRPAYQMIARLRDTIGLGNPTGFSIAASSTAILGALDEIKQGVESRKRAILGEKYQGPPPPVVPGRGALPPGAVQK